MTGNSSKPKKGCNRAQSHNPHAFIATVGALAAAEGLQIVTAAGARKLEFADNTEKSDIYSVATGFSLCLALACIGLGGIPHLSWAR